MGAASRQRHTATMLPHQFHCLLDELPLHLVPQHFLNRQSCRHDPAQELFLNPECSFLPAGAVPDELQAHPDLLEGFNLQGIVAWVRDPVLAMLHPFWLGPRLEETVSRLRTGEPASSVPDEVRLLLAQAGILTPADHSECRFAEWSEIARVRAQAFRERNSAPLSNLIHPFNLAALRRYYRYAVRRGAIRLGDEQSARRYVAHNECVARYFHHQIANAVSAIVGEPVKPSYVYLASYLSGAELKKHTDRQHANSVSRYAWIFLPNRRGQLRGRFALILLKVPSRFTRRWAMAWFIGERRFHITGMRSAKDIHPRPFSSITFR